MTEPWQKVSILIVGCGSIGKRHARCLCNLGLKDIRICDPMASQREALLKQTPGLKAYSDFESGLSDNPNTVLLCTPPDQHIPQIIQAINAGCLDIPSL